MQGIKTNRFPRACHYRLQHSILKRRSGYPPADRQAEVEDALRWATLLLEELRQSGVVLQLQHKISIHFVLLEGSELISFHYVCLEVYFLNGKPASPFLNGRPASLSSKRKACFPVSVTAVSARALHQLY